MYMTYAAEGLARQCIFINYQVLVGVWASVSYALVSSGGKCGSPAGIPVTRRLLRQICLPEPPRMLHSTLINTAT